MAQRKERNKIIDIAKGLCIILVVVGHSRWCSYAFSFIYLFHMPCFFFLSGLLFGEKYFSNLFEGIKNKLKRYYLPFVKWQLLFLLFHNVFAQLYVYDYTLELPQFLENAIKIITMTTGGEPLLGGLWFLISLTGAAIASIVLCAILNKYNRLTNRYLSASIIISLIIAASIEYIPFRVPQIQSLFAFSFFLSGYLFKKNKILEKGILKFGILCFAIPGIAAFYFDGTIHLVSKLEVFLYYFTGIAGSIGVMSLSYYISKLKINFFEYLGDKTLYILVFHYISFKIVSFIYLYINNLPLELLTPTPTLTERLPYMWIFYTISGIVIPILIWNTVKKIEKMISQNFSKTANFW